MDIEKYLTNLPAEVLLTGKFCVTRYNDKKPYDPIKKLTIGSKDEFYSIEELLDSNIEEYETIGIKVMDNISAIDIDHCVNNGKLSDIALDIIHNIKSYTEISPSGTGIRILFKAANEFERDRYKIKNSLNGVEYYDGVDQITKGGRMVRLSGNKVFDYDFIEVDTSDILDRYMIKDFQPTVKLNEGDININKCFFIGEFLKKDYSIYDIYYRHMAVLSESEWDLILLNHIAFYTDNLNEVRYIFENSIYFKKKDQRHLNKWRRKDYAENLLKIIRPTVANSKVLHYIEIFDSFEPKESTVVNSDLLAFLAIQIGFIKPSYISKYHVNPIISYDEQDVVNHLMVIAQHRKNIITYIKNSLERDKKVIYEERVCST